MGSRKLVLMNLFAGQEERCRRREKGLRDTEGEGEGGTSRESGTDTYTLPCVK